MGMSRRGVQVCEIDHKQAWLGTEFGEKIARQNFGDETVDALARITRGKNKGKINASLVWQKCRVGGWNYDMQCAIYPGWNVWKLVDAKEVTIASGRYKKGIFIDHRIEQAAQEARRLISVRLEQMDFINNLAEHAATSFQCLEECRANGVDANVLNIVMEQSRLGYMAAFEARCFFVTGIRKSARAIED